MLYVRFALMAGLVPAAAVTRLVCADITRFLDDGRLGLAGQHPRPAVIYQLGAGTAAAGAIMAAPAAAVPAIGIFAGVAASLATIDNTTGILPSRIVFPTIAGGLLMAFLGHGAVDARASAIGAGWAWLVLALTGTIVGLAAGPRAALGFGRGDWNLAAAIGAWLGLLPTLAGFVAAMVLMTAMAAWRNSRAPAPFGPAFCAFSVLFFLSDVFGALQ